MMARVKWSGLARRDPKGISPAAVNATGHGVGARRPGGTGVTSGPQGLSERGALGAFSSVQLDRSEKTPSRELIQPGAIKHLSSNS